DMGLVALARRTLTSFNKQRSIGIDHHDMAGGAKLLMILAPDRRIIPAHQFEPPHLATGVGHRLIRAREWAVLQRTGVKAPPPAVVQFGRTIEKQHDAAAHLDHKSIQLHGLVLLRVWKNANSRARRRCPHPVRATSSIFSPALTPDG